MLSSRQTNTSNRAQSARTRSASQSRTATSQRLEMEERLFKSAEQIKELKSKNNKLQEDVRMLKARLRWPPHIQDARMARESQQEKQLLQQLEAANLQLTEKCRFYERTINQLEQHAQDSKPEPALDSQINLTSRVERNDEKGFTSNNQQVAVMKRSLEEWKDHANCYKQQASDAVTRLKEMEERLAQMLRLHTLDSAELIRTSRASKHAVAQITAAQEENRHLKDTIEKLQQKYGDLTEQFEAEKNRNAELQENLAQVQQLRSTNAELLQEITEVKQERAVMQTRLQGLVRETAEVSNAESELVQGLRRQMETMRAEHSGRLQQLQQALETKMHETSEAAAEADDLREQLRRLQRRAAALTPAAPRPANTDSRSTQTIDLHVDLKPPEATVELSNEESDLVLSQMNKEVEGHKHMMRSMQSMCEAYKKELAQLHEQLQCERKSYARQLSLEMSQFKALQEQLKNCAPGNKMVVTADVEPHFQPKPQPRKLVKEEKKHHREDELKELVLEIESLSLPEGSVLLKRPELMHFFVDFRLSGDGQESHETPSNFPLPRAALTSVAIGHRHSWQGSVLQALADCHIKFDLVAENEVDAPDECTELGVGKVPVSELMTVATSNLPFTLNVPIYIEEQIDTAVAHLTVAITKVTSR